MRFGGMVFVWPELLDARQEIEPRDDHDRTGKYRPSERRTPGDIGGQRCDGAGIRRMPGGPRVPFAAALSSWNAVRISLIAGGQISSSHCAERGSRGNPGSVELASGAHRQIFSSGPASPRPTSGAATGNRRRRLRRWALMRALVSVVLIVFSSNARRASTRCRTRSEPIWIFVLSARRWNAHPPGLTRARQRRLAIERRSARKKRRGVGQSRRPL